MPAARRPVAALLLVACLAAGCATAATSAATPAPAPTPATAAAASTATAEQPDAVAARADGDDPTGIEPLDPAPTPDLPATVTDATGTQHTVTDVDRIVPLTGGLAEIVFSLGLGDRVVGRDVATTFAEAAHLPVVTRGHDVSAEGVLSLRPTVVLADTSTGPPEALDAVRAADVPVVVVDEAWTLEEVAPRIRAVAAALGVADAGEELVGRTEAEIAAARQREWDGEPPTVAFLYLRGNAGVYLLGGDGSGADSLIEAVGAVDAGSQLGLGPFTPVTTEALVAAAPDVILVMTKGLESVGGVDGLVEIPGIAQTPAGRQRRVVAIEDGLLLGFGPRTATTLRLLADGLHGGG